MGGSTLLRSQPFSAPSHDRKEGHVPRNKAMKKSGWKQRDAKYRQDVSDRRRANKVRKAFARAVEIMAGKPL